MKKAGFLILFALVALSFSCKDNVCIKCSTIVSGAAPDETLCSKSKDERMSFQTNWIQQGYNCTVE